MEAPLWVFPYLEDGRCLPGLRASLHQRTGILREMRPMSLTKHETEGKCGLRSANDTKFDWNKRGREAGIFLLIGAFLSYIDPYGATSSLPTWGKFIYWTGLIIIGAYAGALAGYGLGRISLTLTNWIKLPLMALATTLAVSACIILIQIYIVQDPVPFGYLHLLFGNVFVISMAITAIIALIEQNISGQSQTGSNREGGNADAVFLERLPIKYRGSALYAVSSEDHYLRVHTDRGEELILMRLADAVRELSGADGMQTHRSWWVAKAGIAEARKEGGKLRLVLKSGAEVPVSRSFAKAVREAGFI